jgi:hypothetical protein
MRTIIRLYFELCLDEAGSSPGYNKLSFDEVSMCNFDGNRVYRHSENIVRHDLDVSFRDIYTPLIIELTFVVNEGLPDLRIEDMVCIKGT